MAIILLPFKLLATIILFVLKIAFGAVAFIAYAIAIPFVMLSEIFGSLLAVFSALGVGAMILCWRFGDLDGKTVIIAALVLGMLCALLFTAETFAAAIEEKLSSASDFFGDLIEDIWT